MLHAALQDAADTRQVVISSGALNDLTKLAAHRCARPYMIVATAASMDGYTACGAAITRAQLEQSVRHTHANPIITDNAVPQSLAKHLDADHLRRRLIALRERWPMLRQRLIEQLMPAAELRGLLLAAGCLPAYVESLFAPGGFWFEA